MNKHSHLIDEAANQVPHFALAVAEDVLGPITSEIVRDPTLSKILSEIPIIKWPILAVKIGLSFRDKWLFDKVEAFLQQLKDGGLSEEILAEHRRRIEENDNQLHRELEFVTAILDNTIEMEKAQMLARLYLKLYSPQNRITWDKFCVYASLLNQLIPSDLSILQQFNDAGGKRRDEISNIASVLRLNSLGLIERLSAQRISPDGHISIRKQEFNYELTTEGREFHQMIFGA